MMGATKVVVVGGGPVGALAALYAARRGYETELYELRGDPNRIDPSLRPDIAIIPVTLSERGIQAIAGASVPGLLEGILDNSMHVFNRLVHTDDGRGNEKLTPMAYGPHRECLYVFQRDKITNHCLLALEKQPNVKLFFNHKLVSCDFEHQIAKFESFEWETKPRDLERTLADDVANRKPNPGVKIQKQVSYGFLIGADGTHSSARQCLMRTLEIDFSQTYFNAMWCDLVFPSDAAGNHSLDSRCIHIWPADESIVVGQPDLDGSVRAGLVCPTEELRYYEQHPRQFAGWFKTEFPGIVPELLSEEEVRVQFLKHQKIPLKSLKINTFGYEDSVLLLGDSVHTMAPFHAMGMVTGLEDVRVFFQQFRDPAVTRVACCQNGETPTRFCPEGTVAAYAAHRLPDVHAMVDLAHAHYDELRNGIRSPIKKMRKAFDLIICRWAPFLDWTPLYVRIHFGHERFSDVLRKENRQEMAWRIGWVTASTLLLMLSFNKVNVAVNGILGFVRDALGSG